MRLDLDLRRSEFTDSRIAARALLSRFWTTWRDRLVAERTKVVAAPISSETS